MKNYFGLQIVMSTVVFAVLLSVLPYQAVAQRKSDDRWLPKPADWCSNDWYQYFESSVQIVLGEGYSAVGGKFPIVDVYSALSAIGSSTKTALQFWLRKKMVDAQTAEDWERADRYEAFYTCLTNDDCDALRVLQQDLKDALADNKGAVNDEKPVSRNGDTWTGNYAAWIGTWNGDGDRMHFYFSGSGNSPSVKFDYAYPDAYWNYSTGGGQIKNCKFNGSEAICEWTDEMTTATHTSKASGTIKLTLYGDDTMRYSATLSPGGTVSWTGGKPLWGLEPGHYSMLLRDVFKNSDVLKRLR